MRILQMTLKTLESGGTIMLISEPTFSDPLFNKRVFNSTPLRRVHSKMRTRKSSNFWSKLPRCYRIMTCLELSSSLPLSLNSTLSFRVTMISSPMCQISLPIFIRWLNRSREIYLSDQARDFLFFWNFSILAYSCISSAVLNFSRQSYRTRVL